MPNAAPVDASTADAGADDATADGDINWICLDDTINNIATNTKNSYDTLETKVLTGNYLLIDGIPFRYDENMTWEDWCNSAYNTLGLEVKRYLMKHPSNNKNLFFGFKINYETEDGTQRYQLGTAPIYGSDIVFPTSYILATERNSEIEEKNLIIF